MIGRRAPSPASGQHGSHDGRDVFDDPARDRCEGLEKVLWGEAARALYDVIRAGRTSAASCRPTILTHCKFKEHFRFFTSA